MNLHIKSFTDRLWNKTIILKDSYSLVLVMFNCALLMHFLLKGGGLLFFPVVLLLFNFRLWFVSFVQICFGIYFLAASFPRQANHANIEFFFCAAIICLFIFKARNRNASIPTDLTSHIFRVLTVSIYFYAGFHKLNSDFFDTSVSCANEFGGDGMSRMLLYFQCYKCSDVLSSLPFPLITILLELVVPFGLFWHRTRKSAAIFLLVFHLYLGMYSFANFSSFAIFLLVGCLMDFNSAVSLRMKNALKIYVFSALMCAFYSLFGPGGLLSFVSYRVILAATVATFTPAVICFFIAFFKEYREKKSVMKFHYIGTLGALFIFISLWALKNYVGLGTIGNFTMFSNLVTEKSRNNHLLIDTRHTKIWDFEEDHVQILELDSTLAWQRENKKLIAETLIPAIELSYLISVWSAERPGRIRCTLIYKGKKMVIDDLKNSQFSAYRWWYRFLPFRFIQLNGPHKCRW